MSQLAINQTVLYLQSKVLLCVTWGVWLVVRDLVPRTTTMPVGTPQLAGLVVSTMLFTALCVLYYVMRPTRRDDDKGIRLCYVATGTADAIGRMAFNMFMYLYVSLPTATATVSYSMLLILLFFLSALIVESAFVAMYFRLVSGWNTESVDPNVEFRVDDMTYATATSKC